MKKLDVNQEITTRVLSDGVEILNAVFDGQPHPTITECDSYKNLVEFFKNAIYSVKRNNGDKPELLIKHDKYNTLKIIEGEGGSQFNKFGVIFTDDSLEAKIVMDIPILNKEFKIVAIRKGTGDKYKCVTISYNNNLVYPKVDVSRN